MVKTLGLLSGEQTCCVKSLDPLEGEEPLSIPTPKCAKITGRVGEAAGLQAMHEKQLMPC